jgi:hypothetical protein
MCAGFAAEAHSVEDPVAAAELLEALLRDRDTVLVKGSRRLGLERVGATLRGAREERERDPDAVLARHAGSGLR